MNRKCKIGFPCGKTCISRKRLCWANLSTNDSRVAESFSQFVNRLVGINLEQSEPKPSMPEGLTERQKIAYPAFKPEEFSLENYRIIEDYTQAGYRNINKRLRGYELYSKSDEIEADEKIDQMSKAYESLKSLESDNVTYRGAYLPSDLLSNIKEGETWSDMGYSSTSKDIAIANVDFGGNILFKYNLKGGTNNAKDISLVGLSHEEEVLIRPNTQFKIKSVSNDDDGIYIVELEEL